jgi:Uma2 family endonuclease
MTALPGWAELPPSGLTAADYEALPEEVCRRVEVVDGAVIVSAAPRRQHQIIARRLANLLEVACGGKFAVATDVDLRLRDVPLLNRRPDIVVYDASLPDTEVPRPSHCVLVIEVMSPGSVTTDQTDKPAEYAAAGISHFWRVEPGTDDRELAVFRYWLPAAGRGYAPPEISSGVLSVTDPFAVSVDLAALPGDG